MHCLPAEPAFDSYSPPTLGSRDRISPSDCWAWEIVRLDNSECQRAWHHTGLVEGAYTYWFERAASIINVTFWSAACPENTPLRSGSNAVNLPAITPAIWGFSMKPSVIKLVLTNRNNNIRNGGRTVYELWKTKVMRPWRTAPKSSHVFKVKLSRSN